MTEEEKMKVSTLLSITTAKHDTIATIATATTAKHANNRHNYSNNSDNKRIAKKHNTQPLDNDNNSNNASSSALPAFIFTFFRKSRKNMDPKVVVSASQPKILKETQHRNNFPLKLEMSFLWLNKSKTTGGTGSMKNQENKVTSLSRKHP